MIGHFITRLRNRRGRNRLDIIGEGGKIVFEDRR